VLFAAGGNDLDLQRFATKAKKKGIDVVSKYDLLFDNDRRELDNLLWDQRRTPIERCMHAHADSVLNRRPR